MNYYLRQGGYVFNSVGLFVCVLISYIIQKVTNGFWWKLQDSSAVLQGMIA